MPTWRGQVNNYDTESVIADTTNFLQAMDCRLKDNQVMYVKYHPLMKLEFEDSEYRHIRSFPADYEYYEILNTADILITDYSSVFYDFANSRRKSFFMPMTKKSILQIEEYMYLLMNTHSLRLRPLTN